MTITTIYCETDCPHKNYGQCGLDFITIINGECAGLNIAKDEVEG